MTHLTDDTLFAAAGGQIDPGASSHLESCVECRARLASVRSLERALRAIPLEEPSPALAGAVLARIGLRESPSWLYTLLRNVGPLVALGAILAAVSRRWTIPWLVAATAMTLSMYVVLTTVYPGNPSISDWLGIGPSLSGEIEMSSRAFQTSRFDAVETRSTSRAREDARPISWPIRPRSP